MRGGEAACVDGEGDAREGLGERNRVDPGLPDVVPGAEGQGRSDCLLPDARVEVREFEGDAKSADGPAGNAELTGDRGPVTAILTAHVHDAGANPRIVRLLRALPCNCCRCFGSLFLGLGLCC